MWYRHADKGNSSSRFRRITVIPAILVRFLDASSGRYAWIRTAGNGVVPVSCPPGTIDSQRVIKTDANPAGMHPRGLLPWDSGNRSFESRSRCQCTQAENRHRAR